MYKHSIKGFLHWGLNYYNSRISLYPINPYATTSADGVFPSGDPFILYPSKDGAYNSIRGKVIYEAIEDMKVCATLEKYIGRDAVVELIDSMAGEELKFDKYNPVHGVSELLYFSTSFAIASSIMSATRHSSVDQILFCSSHTA